ncbi:MAG TPA: sugar phosphate isomerase/epimerase family protein [Phycisphaerae bacterium]|nr:sugar phosphate isomerase/epimerase family protein [Phycisphaerae bacterium]
MNLRLAYSTNAYMRFDLLDALRRIAALGYHGVELMADTPHLWPSDTTPHRLDEVRAELDRLGLTISNINAFMMNKIGDKRQPYWHPSWIEPDAAYRQIRIDHSKAALTMARQLGAGNITTEPGGPLSPGQSYSQAMDDFVEALKPVVEHAERGGVRLLVEPEPGLLIERFEQYEELAEHIDSPYLGLNFDVGHAYCVGQEPSEWIGRMARHSAHYHFEDIAATRVHQHLVPGHGAIDFAATLGAIRATDYGGWVTVELYPYVDDPDAAGREAKDNLERIAVTL